MQQRVPSVTAPFRTPYRVEHLIFDGYTDGPRGEQQALYKTALRDVYGWASPTAKEAGNMNVVTLTADLQLFAPTFPVSEVDRFRVQGLTYEVDGLPAQYDFGPFGFKPGMVVNLKRVA